MNEFQAAYQVGRQLDLQDALREAEQVAEALDAGHPVVSYQVPKYCRFTDAVAGSRTIWDVCPTDADPVEWARRQVREHELDMQQEYDPEIWNWRLHNDPRPEASMPLPELFN